MLTITYAQKSSVPLKRVAICKFSYIKKTQESFFFITKSRSLTRERIYMRLLMYKKESHVWKSKWGKDEK